MAPCLTHERVQEFGQDDVTLLKRAGAAISARPGYQEPALSASGEHAAAEPS